MYLSSDLTWPDLDVVLRLEVRVGLWASLGPQVPRAPSHRMLLSARTAPAGPGDLNSSTSSLNPPTSFLTHSLTHFSNAHNNALSPSRSPLQSDSQLLAAPLLRLQLSQPRLLAEGPGAAEDT